METPIATYSETRFDGARTFKLFSGKIVVAGTKTLKSEFEATIPLNGLISAYDRIQLRNSGFMAGLWLAVIGAFASVTMISGFRMSFAQLPPILAICIAVAGVLLSIVTWKKVEFVQFKNAGGIVILDVAKSGKDAVKFDLFIKSLIVEIEAANRIPER